MIKDFLDKNFPNNEPGQLLLFAAVLASSLLFLIVARRLIARRMKRRASSGGSIQASIPLEAEKRIAPLIFCAGAYLSFGILTLGPSLKQIIAVLFSVAFGFLSVRLVVAIFDILVERHWLWKEGSPVQLRTIKGVSAILKAAVWGIALFFLLDNLGVNITALFAGLGIGGIAIALAAQTILGDVFSCFVIFFDKPFEVGDFISVDAYSGTIEHIGIKTTRIRSLSGEQLVFSNSDLTTSRLRNYKRLQKRRINFKIGVAYETRVGDVRAIPAIVAGIVQGIEDAEFERAHFASYGDYSLVFEVVYYVIVSDYLRYMDIQQEINVRLKEEFEKRGIAFAYPTQTLYIEQAAGTVPRPVWGRKQPS